MPSGIVWFPDNSHFHLLPWSVDEWFHKHIGMIRSFCMAAKMGKKTTEMKKVSVNSYV